MSAFLHTDAGEINSRFVVSIKGAKARRADGSTFWRKRVTYLEGGEVSTTLSDAVHTDGLDATVIPATPGYFFVNVYSDAPYEIYQEPIVAWGIDSGAATPIGLQSRCDGWGILDPQGRVTIPEVCGFHSVEAYRLDRIKQIQERAASSETQSPALPLPPPVPFAETD